MQSNLKKEKCQRLGHVLLGLIFFFLAVLESSLGAVKIKPRPVDLIPKQSQSSQADPSSMPPFEVMAKQALLIDYATGVVLFEKNADELMYPSSMTKIMTSYMIFEKLKEGSLHMDNAFPVSERAWRMEGTKMFVPINAMVSVEDLLKGIIIQSGNDACVVVAEGLCGSEEAFCDEMTQKAHEMGAIKTTFKNASGWPDPDHLTTARDLAIIAHRTLTDFPEFYGLFGIKEFIYNNIRQWNRNPLLYKNVGCDGIKTGHTDIGGYGIVASVVQGTKRLILVVNGLPSEQARANEVLKLMTWGLQMFKNHTLFKSGETVDFLPIWLGEYSLVQATVAEDVVVTLPRNFQKGIKVDIKYDTPIMAPIAKGTIIGKLIVKLPSDYSLEVPLVASTAIGKANFFKRIKDSFSYLIWGKA